MNFQRVISVLVSSTLTATLVGCTGSGLIQNHQRSVERIQALVKESQQEEKKADRLVHEPMPGVISQALSKDAGKFSQKNVHHFDITANKMPAREFFTHLASLDSVNIVVAPDVKASITLSLKQVSLPDVLDAVADGYGFQIQRKSFGYKVVQQRLVTRIYTLDSLALTRSGSSSMNINDLQSTHLDSATSSSSSTSSNESSASSEVRTTFGDKDHWSQVQASIEQIISSDSQPGKSKETPKVSIDRANGLLVVRATPAQQKLVARYLRSLHNISSKQIMIDARIIEVELKKDQEVGVSQLGVPFVKWTNTDTASSLTYQNGTAPTGAANYKDFSNIINTLSVVGHVSLLSSPQVSILNNQKALIKVGQDEYYSMGGSTTYLSSSTGGSDPIESNNLQSFFSGVALDVTPQISKTGIITMHIHPIVSSVTTVETQVNGGTLDLPKTKIRETDTIVQAKNGQVIIIGGLISDSSNLTHNKVPGLEKSSFNTNRNDTYEKKELFVLLRARVVNDKSWLKELDRVSASLDDYVDSDSVAT